MNYSSLLTALLPDLIILVSLFAALGVDYGLLRQQPLATRNRIAASIASAGLALGLIVTATQIIWIEQLRLGQDQLVLTPFTLAAKALMFGLAIIVCIFSAGKANNSHVSEYYALIILSALGGGFLVCTENLLLLFVALELMSLSLYALTAFNKRSLAANEAAIKYFTFGAVSSAFLLFGLSYLYGAAQTLNLRGTASAIALMPTIPPLLRVAYLLILVGLGFKIAMAPFHFWAPDVYENAPAPVAAWIASGSKVAGFFVLIKLLQAVTLPDSTPIWAGAVAFGAALSLAVGNLGALRQGNVKRLLAYSAIGHAGYMLTGILGTTADGFVAALFYIVLYAFANLGAFGIITLVSERNGTTGDIADFSGLWKRQPLLAVLAAVFFLSLAGIPPLAGFVGKFYLFFAAIQTQPQIAAWYQGYYWLVAVALLFSAVSLYYYLQVLKACFVTDPTASAPPIRVSAAEWICLIISGSVILLTGLFPSPLLHFIQSTFTS